MVVFLYADSKNWHIPLMKRILITGSGGSGKSTLALELGRKLNIPVHHLDQLYWKPGWERPDKEEWVALQEKLCAEPEWVIDGNYASTLDLRMEACDMAILLDLPRMKCLWRVLKRRWGWGHPTYHGRPEGCDEKMDFAFYRWIWNYPKKVRPKVLNHFKAFGNEKKIRVLRSDEEIEGFLQSLGGAR